MAFEKENARARIAYIQKAYLLIVQQRCFAVDALLVTRGAGGMTLYERARRLHVPADSREVSDVTGAGDTVIATLAVMLAAGCAMDEAVGIANRAAGIVVGKFGTAVALPRELFDMEG